MRGIKYLILYAAGVLLWSAGCERDKPIRPGDYCEDGTCCGSRDTRFKLITILENAPADYVGLGFQFRTILVDKQRSFGLCFNQWEWLVKQKFEITSSVSDPNPPYRYRVWGKLFWYEGILSTDGSRLYLLNVERVEKIN